LIDGPVNVPLILVFEFVAGAVVAGAVVASAVAAAVVAAAVAPELLLATGFELLVAAALAFVVAFVVAAADEDDEADALAVVSAPAIGAPAMFIALVVPN
jgi:hypothetical protein